EQRVATLWENRSRGGQRGHFWFGGENPRSFQPAALLPRAPHQNYAIVSYWLGQPAEGPVALEITSLDGRHRHRATLPAGAGIRRYEWDLRFDPAADGVGERRGIVAGPGTYQLTLTVGT